MNAGCDSLIFEERTGMISLTTTAKPSHQTGKHHNDLALLCWILLAIHFLENTFNNIFNITRGIPSGQCDNIKFEYLRGSHDETLKRQGTK